VTCQSLPSFHDNSRAGGAVQQPLEVKAGELIAGVLAYMRGKGSERRRIVCLKLCKSFLITAHSLVFVLLSGNRLESAQRLGPSAQHKVAHRPAMKVRHFHCQGRADADAGAELFIGGLEPRRGIDRVSIGGVIEESLATEIANQRRPGMDANARDTNALRPGKN
jgi:hypothetical protein